MIKVPTTMPIMLPRGPALLKKELPVTTNEPHPIAVPMDRENAPKADIDLLDFV